ncbi:hypothetical protein C7447_101842 [Tenacibaculum adriaticum]|uniref:Uncharacterized protein n=1 Tax=Tenacibaculum adriaticum TaxID=413713 RepID=A0A5S5DWK5_9FLAO|nr:hypothetical protein [Tenacibaculum adriaticum]TYQ00232.1 hypothetical protein C7447_101842 [Tenacibaculum adriaticum]
MARLQILGHAFISYEYDLRDVYWTEMSQKVIDKFGNKSFKDSNEVEEILLYCFKYLVKKFKELVFSETSFTFFMYVFWLHEESIKIYLQHVQGASLSPIDEDEFARSRRILKAILEQGCDIDLKWGKFPEDSKELEKFDEKVQHLLYVCTWLYHFADHIAYQKMVEEYNRVEFDEDNLIVIDFQHHYGTAYHTLFPAIGEEYERGAYELEIVPELKQKINECFKIDYDWAGAIIYEIKKYHNPKDSSLQTIEPYVLPKNLAQQFGITEEEAKLFYDGLTISRNNKMSLEDLILKPYSMDRFMYRPILVYQIDGIERALVGEEKYPESVMVLATNALKWNTLPKEWLQNDCIKTFMQLKGNEHDKLLEDEVENILLDNKLRFARNIKSLKQHKANNINIDNVFCGEIDFLIINTKLKKLLVVDCKYNKARYEAVGYRTDDTNFKAKYEPKMLKKNNWILNNIAVVNDHFQIIYQDDSIDITGYEVETVFFINTPTFYMFNGDYKAITLSQILDYLDGNYKYNLLSIKHNGEEIKHPFFRKPKMKSEE